jgi:hypothetical protein
MSGLGNSFVLWLILVAIFAFLALKEAGLQDWLRRRRSRSSPWAETTIEGGCVELIYQGRRRARVLLVSYSYSVNGERYHGSYTQSFQGESEAQGVLRSLQEMPPPARYKSSNPSESVMDPYRDAILAVASDDRQVSGDLAKKPDSAT